MALPAGLFSPRRRPAYPLYDELGAPTAVDAHWVEDSSGETVYIDRVHAEAFRAFLRTSLREILDDRDVAASDRGWAAHRALLHEVAFLFSNSDGRARPNNLVTIARDVALLIRQHQDPVDLFARVRGRAPYVPVVNAMETAIGAMSLAIADGQRDTNFLAMLGAGAVFADVGLLDLPAAIRDAERPLKPTELRVMYCHPGISLRRMRAIGLASPVAEHVVSAHHERWDGRGYPAALSGEQIPIEARYAAVADAYTSMTVAHRSRPAIPRAAALEEIARPTGQFDPLVVGHLVRLLGGQAAA